VTAPVPLPDPPLVDGELRLRPWTTDDASALAAAWADPEIVRWTGVPAARSEQAARRWIAGDERRRAGRLSLDLVIDVDGAVAGEVGITRFHHPEHAPEMGWWVAAEHRGRHRASRAVRLLADWAMDHLTPALEAVCDPANPASGAVARNAGFVLDGAIWRFERPARGGTLHL
jgi:RimJ/RimL family protein N-acetyltransferase